MSKLPRIVFLIFILALLIRLAFLFFAGNRPYLNGIVSENVEIATNLVQGNGFSERNAQGQPIAEYHELPGYPAFLAFFMLIFGQALGLVAVKVFQIILSSLGVFIIYLLIKENFQNEKAAILASFFWAIWWSEARPVIVTVHDALIPFLILLATYIFLKSLKQNKTKHFIYAALIIALVSYSRSDYVLLPIFFVLALGLIKKGWLFALKTLILMGLVIFAVLLPWAIRNFIIFHQFIFTRTVLWQSMWEGFGEFKNPFGAVLDDGITFDQVHQQYPNIQYGTPEYENVLKEKVLTAVKSNPFWYLQMLPKRLALMIFSPKLIGLSSFFDSHYDRGVFLSSHSGEGTIQYLFWLAKTSPKELFLRYVIGSIIQLVLIVLSLFALIKFWANYKSQLLVLISLPLYAYLSHTPIYWEPRVLVAGEFPYLILSALALVWCCSRFQGQK